jgi:dihydroorotase-like cyclic amidohydrolase
MVKAMGRDISYPDTAVLIDLREYTVLPELIDCHTHQASTLSKRIQKTKIFLTFSSELAVNYLFYYRENIF